MTIRGDTRTFKNEDLVLRVTSDIDPEKWDESKYEAYLDQLCGFREYQKDAIRTTLRYLLGGAYRSLEDLAKENFEQSEELQQRYGSWTGMQRHLQLPQQLSCSIDQATATGKSFVLYGIGAILLAEGAVDHVLVLCPSNTIEAGLIAKFRDLAASNDLRELLPRKAVYKTPRIINGSESMVGGSICVENYHAILENTKSSIRESVKNKGARVAVLNDEAHHVANESGATSKKWKEFLQDPMYGFRIVVGVSGTCYVGDDYFSDVVSRYSLRQAIEEKFVKSVEYVDELPPSAERPEEKLQLIYKRHQDIRQRLRSRNIRPLSIIVVKGIADAEKVANDLIDFLKEREGGQGVEDKVLVVTSAGKHQQNVRELRRVDDDNSKVEWIVSVSMLSEGWDVKNVFQIIPHQERAFNSKLLIAQVLGRGLRRPDDWMGQDPVVTIFNHDAWSARIRHLVTEILEIERRLSSVVAPASPFNFDLHTLDYTKTTDTTTYAKRGEYKLLEDGFVDLPTQVESEDVTVTFSHALTGKQSKFRTSIEHKTWSIAEVAQQMYLRLKSIDEESSDAEDPKDRTSYSTTLTLERCTEIVRDSLDRAKITTGRITDENRQKFLQSLGTLRRKAAKRVLYTLAAKSLVGIDTTRRPAESCAAAEIRRGSKTIFYTPQTVNTLVDDQKTFFEEVKDPDGDFRGGREEVKSADFKTPVNLVIADGTPERRFLRQLTARENAEKIDAWIKNSAVGFYSIEYSWKKGNAAKRGQFSPDFFLKQGAAIFVVEIKGDDEINEPAPDNVKKHEYATEHFSRLNQRLQSEGQATSYQFNMLSPKSFDVFFQKLRDGELRDFRSLLDVEIAKVLKSEL